MKWVVEAGVFGPEYERVVAAIRAAGHEVVEWREEWLTERADWVAEEGGQDHVLFHGSLNVASKLREVQPAWVPGAFCDVERHTPSQIAEYATIKKHLLNPKLLRIPVAALGHIYLSENGPLGTAEDGLFVRPDSPLKQFSGRVIPKDKLDAHPERPDMDESYYKDFFSMNPALVDYGFYFEDPQTPIVLAPARTDIAVEFRCVVVGEEVVSCAAYNPNGREATEVSSAVKQAGLDYAKAIAADYIDRPERVYVLDLAMLDDGSPRVIETNPFSGADLYTSGMGSHEIDALVKALSEAAQQFVLPCCDTMAAQLRYWCDQHKDDCPDTVVRHGGDGTVFLRAENACYNMRYCPWCGRLIEENDEKAARIRGL